MRVLVHIVIPCTMLTRSDQPFFETRQQHLVYRFLSYKQVSLTHIHIRIFTYVRTVYTW